MEEKHRDDSGTVTFSNFTNNSVQTKKNPHYVCFLYYMWKDDPEFRLERHIILQAN